MAQEFNTIPETESDKQEAKAREILGSAGKNLVIHSDWKFDNGKNIHVGDNFLANYNWTVLDVGKVTIGDNVWIGPNTDIYTVNHPVTAMGVMIIGLRFCRSLLETMCGFVARLPFHDRQ